VLLGRRKSTADSGADNEQLCEGIKDALEKGRVGDIVAKHERLILKYYSDVLNQANRSFDSAISMAEIGFWVLIGTVGYVVAFDILFHIKTLSMTAPSLTVTSIGLVSGALIEFVAGVNFWLYARAGKQFGAFHICLERTHRYLVAFKIADEIKQGKDDTLRNLVCIMANAPMIPSENFTGLSLEEARPPLSTRAASAGG
jgi:hypothetical protein